MKVGFNSSNKFFSNGKYYAKTAVKATTFNPPNFYRPSDKIKRLHDCCQSAPAQFYSSVATALYPNKADSLVPELKSLVDKMFWVLDNIEKDSQIYNLMVLAGNLIDIYDKGKFRSHKQILTENIFIFFKTYLALYMSKNSYRLGSNGEEFQIGLVKKWGFYYGMRTMVSNFHTLFELICGPSIYANKEKGIYYDKRLEKKIEEGYEKLGFKEREIKELLRLEDFQTQHFIEWFFSSKERIFNETLESTFTKYFLNFQDIEKYLDSIYNTLGLAKRWIEKETPPTPLLPFLVILEIFSSDGFSGSKGNFDFFFGNLERFYAWIVFQRCVESFSLTKPEYDENFLILDDVKNEIKNNVQALTNTQIDFLKAEFKNYRETVDYFKNLIYDHENDIPNKHLTHYKQFTDFLDFIFELFANVRVESSHSVASQLTLDDNYNSMSYFYP